MIRFAFQEHGRVFIPIHVKPLDDISMLPVVFKVDTGADMSTISKVDLENLGYDMDWIKQNAFLFEETVISPRLFVAGGILL